MAVMMLQDGLAAVFDVFGLVVKKTGRTDKRLNGIQWCCSKIRRCFQVIKQLAGYPVHLLIGALG